MQLRFGRCKGSYTTSAYLFFDLFSCTCHLNLRGIFSGWNPEDTDIDHVISMDKLPLVVEDAVSLMGYALDEFIARSQKDGSNLLLLLSQQITVYDGKNKKQHEILTKLASERGIPMIDQYDYILSIGGKHE